MRVFGKLTSLTVLFLGASLFATADTIQLGSYGTTATAPAGDLNNATTYGTNGTSYSLSSIGHTWSAPLADSNWVSYDQNSYPGGSSAPVNATYVYDTTFFLNASESYTGQISVMADDKASVYLNGQLLVSTNGANPGLMTAATYILYPQYFVAGLNVLTFDVQQIHGGATGVDFDGSVVGSPVPEPSSLMLLSTGLLSVGCVVRRKLQA